MVPSEASEKSPTTPLGIDPETLRLVAQCYSWSTSKNFRYTLYTFSINKIWTVGYLVQKSTTSVRSPSIVWPWVCVLTEAPSPEWNSCTRKIWGYHSGSVFGFRLLGCIALSIGRWPTFRTRFLTPSWEYISLTNLNGVTFQNTKIFSE